MEKSIEKIWKEGFLKSDALIAPKVNDLYNKKSIHIIDKFKRMFRINLNAILAFSLVFLFVSYFLHYLIMGIIFFVTLMILYVVNRNLLKDLENIDQGQNSYQYLKTFSHWIKKQIAINKQMARFMYPVFFISFILGFWFNDATGNYLGGQLVHKLVTRFPDANLVFGVPLIGIIISVLITAVLVFYGDRIYQWDINVIYGNVLKKLDELLADIESLRD